MKKKPIIKKLVKFCECCGVKIKNAFGPSKYCVKCSSHVSDYQHTIGHLKSKIKRLEKKLYE